MELIVRLSGFVAIVPMLWAVPSMIRTDFPIQQHHWRDTATEEIWTQRYSNCDHGYYVDLPDEIVAYGEKPPSPNHGVTIDLAEPLSTSALGEKLSRYISIENNYNAAELPSLAAIVDDELKSLEKDKSGFHVLERAPTRLGGLNATLLRLRYTEGTKTISEVEIISYRPPGPKGLGDIVYEFCLVTPEDTYSRDRKTFDDITSGFHLTKLPLGVCSNG
jgi:hypothetical protein